MTFPLMPVIAPITTPGETWTSIAAVQYAYDITVNPNTGRWIMAGYGGLATSVAYSDNYGNSWTKVTGPFSSTLLESIEFGNGLFVASEQAGNNLYSSTDGVTWTLRISGSSRDHHKIIYNDGYFVLGSGTGGGNGFIYGSADGINWTYGPQGSVGANSVQCGIYVASLNRTFAGGNQWKYVNAVPTAAVAWTGTPSGYAGVVNSVAWSPTLSLGVIVGTTGIASSPNLITWTSRVGTGTYKDVIWTGDQFVAVGPDLLRTSPDGINWTAVTIPSSPSLNCVEHYNGTLIAGSTLNLTFLRSQ